MKSKTLRLCGYFADNFGDDYMMAVFVRSMRDFEFVISPSEKVSGILQEEPNVRVAESKDGELPTVYVIGSGFMINSRKALFSEIKHFIKGTHFGDFCVGCNLEPVKSVLGRMLIRHKLNKFKLIICRDKKSFAILKNKVRKPKNVYLPDILFSMPDEWLEKSVDAESLGISVMNVGKDAAAMEYYRTLAKVADDYIAATCKRVILFAFCGGEEDDASACETVKELAVQKANISLVKHGSGGEIIKAYSQCKKIIATRFHSAVLAIRMGIDAYPIIYREKMRNMLSDIAYPIGGCAIYQLDKKQIEDFIFSDSINFSLDEEFLKAARGHADVLRGFLHESE